MMYADAVQLDFLPVLFQVIPFPVFVLSPDWLVQNLNPAAQALLSDSNTFAIGQPLAKVLDAPALIQSLEIHAPIKEWAKTDLQCYAPQLQPMHGDNGELLGYILILQDHTALKKLAYTQSEFLRIATHDLRSPLTAMRGFADMLDSGSAGPVTDKQHYFIHKFNSGINQIASLVDNIQDAGRYDPETGFYEMTRSPADIGDMVRSIVSGFLIPVDKPLEVKLSIDPNVPIINIDHKMIERAVVNLFDNAVKYTPANGVITVNVRHQDAQIIVSVSDNGYGVPRESQARLFERYVRVPRKEFGRIKGTGLGLFIVRSIAQRHGGTAWVKSEDGAGATFSFSIPLNDVNLVNSAV